MTRPSLEVGWSADKVTYPPFKSKSYEWLAEVWRPATEGQEDALRRLQRGSSERLLREREKGGERALPGRNRLDGN